MLSAGQCSSNVAGAFNINSATVSRLRFCFQLTHNVNVAHRSERHIKLSNAGDRYISLVSPCDRF